LARWAILYLDNLVADKTSTMLRSTAQSLFRHRRSDVLGKTFRAKGLEVVMIASLVVVEGSAELVGIALEA
jgi:hypothetical protein